MAAMIRRLWPVIAVLAIALMLAFPPFFARDESSAGQPHAFIGYHPRWDPPQPEVAGQTLSDAVGMEVRASQTEVRVNWVRLAVGVLVVLGASIVVQLTADAAEPSGHRD